MTLDPVCFILKMDDEYHYCPLNDKKFDENISVEQTTKVLEDFETISDFAEVEAVFAEAKNANLVGLYILKEDEDEYIERKRQEKQAQKSAEYRVRYHIAEPGGTGRSGKRRKTSVKTQKEKRIKSRID